MAPQMRQAARLRMVLEAKHAHIFASRCCPSLLRDMAMHHVRACVLEDRERLRTVCVCVITGNSRPSVTWLCVTWHTPC